MRKVIPGLLVLAGLATLLFLNARRPQAGDRPSASVMPAPAEASFVPVQPPPPPWPTDLGAAYERARGSGKLVLLYLTRPSDSCQPSARLDRWFADPVLTDALGRLCECVRLEGGDADPALGELLGRMTVRVYPTLNFLSATGDVVHRQRAGLYPAYDLLGRELTDDVGPLLDSEALLDLAADVTASLRAEEAELARLRARSSPMDLLALGRILARRCRPAEALAVLDAAVAAGAGSEARLARAMLHEERGRLAEAAAEHEALVERASEDARAHASRVKALTLRLRLASEAKPPRTDEAQALLQRLGALRGETGDEGVRLDVGLARARAFAALGDVRGLQAELLALAQAAGGGARVGAAWTPARLYALAVLEIEAPTALQEAAQLHARQLVRTHPDSVEAQLAKHGMLDRMRTGSGPN